MKDDFSVQISEAISASGLTQKAFAKLLGVPLRTLESWKAGVRIPPLYVQKAILKCAEKIISTGKRKDA